MTQPLVRGLLLLCLIAVSWPGQAAEFTFYVSAQGDDAWSGRVPFEQASGGNGPFATLGRARDAIRELDRSANDAVTVMIEGGRYFVDQTLVLRGLDGGSQENPVVYRAMGDEPVRLIGGEPVAGFAPVTDEDVLQRLPEAAREHVLQANLKAQGIENYGELQVRGFGRPDNPASFELFFNQTPMTLSRWPNEGWQTIEAAPEGEDGGVFVYEGDRPGRWAGIDDVWLHGLWYHDWADSYVQVKSIDTEAKRIETHEPHGVYGYRANQRWYALNILEELDHPGEWYLDRDEGILYFWPPSPIEEGEAIVSIMERPLIELEGVEHVVLENLVLECVRGDAVLLQGCENVQVLGCTVRNTGRRGIVVDGGRECQIRSNDIAYTGEGGISLVGGDRTTLSPADHLAENNHIHHYSRSVITYSPAIRLNGVGNRMAHNHIHNAPHTAVLFGGNDHVLEFNEVFSVCEETGDVGVFYIGRNWTTRGHIIRHNYFHDIFGEYSHGAKSVYLDDAASGVQIIGNIFQESHEGAFIGGGHDNLVEGNLFIDCDPAVHVDARGLTWAQDHIAEGGGWRMYEKLGQVNYEQPPYIEAYPQLGNLFDDDPAVPRGNVVRHNASFGGRWLRLQNVEREWVTLEDNYVSEDAGAVDWEAQQFQLPQGHEAYEVGFEPIPFREIGLYTDAWRSALPE